MQRGLSPSEEGGVVGSRYVVPIASFEGAPESSIVRRSISACDGVHCRHGMLVLCKAMQMLH